MGIVVQHAPSAFAIGRAASAAGLADWEREEQVRRLRELQFAEGQRQFDVSQSLRRDALDAQIDDAMHRRNVDDQQLRLQRYRTQLAGVESDSDRQAQLYNSQLNREYGLAENDQQNQARAFLQQQENEAADQRQQSVFDQQQQMVEMQANAQQRNWFVQNSPAAMGLEAGPVSPDQIAETGARIEANRQALTFPSQQQKQQLYRGIQEGDPWAIQEGLQRGMLTYTPEQKTAMRGLNEAMARLQTDPRYSPDDRIQGQFQISQQLAAIRPMQVPADQVPPTPLEQFNQQMLTVPDTGMGFPLTYQRGMRNGVETWNLDDSSKTQLDLWKEKEMAKFEQSIGLSANKIVEAQYDAAIEAHKARRPDRKDFETQTALGDVKFDRDAFYKSLDEWQEDMNVLARKFYGEDSGDVDESGQNQGKSGPAKSQQTDQPPQWFLDLPSGSEFTAPDGSRRIKP